MTVCITAIYLYRLNAITNSDMKQLVLVRVDLDRKELGMTPGDANKFFRRLYGYHSCSHYGRYHHWVNGFLDEIDGKRIATGAVLIHEKSFIRLNKYLKDAGATMDIVSDKVFMEKDEFDQLISMGKKSMTNK